MTNKDIEITTTAILKSVIERGTPKEEWLESVGEGIRVYTIITNNWKKQEQEKNNGK